MAALIREGVDRVLADDDRERKWQRALAVVGKYRSASGRRRIAREHDEELVESLLEEWRSS